MNTIRLTFLVFSAFLGLVIYTADVGAGPRYWGWLARIPLGDKICHFGFMLILTALTNLSLRCREIRFACTSLLLGTVIVTIFVAAEEVSQIWIPGRNFDLLDLSADLIGIVCGDLIARRLQRNRRGPSNGLANKEEFPREGV